MKTVKCPIHWECSGSLVAEPLTGCQGASHGRWFLFFPQEAEEPLLQWVLHLHVGQDQRTEKEYRHFFFPPPGLCHTKTVGVTDSLMGRGKDSGYSDHEPASRTSRSPNPLWSLCLHSIPGIFSRYLAFLSLFWQAPCSRFFLRKGKREGAQVPHCPAPTGSPVTPALLGHWGLAGGPPTDPFLLPSLVLPCRGALPKHRFTPRLYSLLGWVFLA